MELYEPGSDSNLIAEQVLLHVKKDMKALDMGTGSGVIVEALLKETSDVTGSDVNPYAVEYCTKKYPKAKFVQSNLFENIKGEFDVITFNPPYLPEDKREDLETTLMTTGGSEGNELLLKFMKQAKEHSTPKGFIITLFSTLTKPDVVFKKTDEMGYEHEVLGTKKLFFETLYCVKFKRKS